MYSTLLNRLIATVVLCGLCLQGCRPDFQLHADEPPRAHPEHDALGQGSQGLAEPLSLRAVLDILSHLDVLGQRAQELTEELEASGGGSNVSDREGQESAEPRERPRGTSEERIQELRALGGSSNMPDQEMQELAEPHESSRGMLEVRIQEIAQGLRALRGGVDAPNRERRELAVPHEGRRGTLEELVERLQILESATALGSAFGAEDWFQYLGKIEEAPPLPVNIIDTLNGPCPFWPGKQVRDTHLLVLIPATVNDKPLSLNLLEELIQHPQGGGHTAKYNNYGQRVQEQFGAQFPTRSYWVLMTRDVLEGSRGQTYAAQQALVAEHAERTQLPYELPGVLEATTAILSYYVRSGERLYSDSPDIYTRCRELVVYKDNHYPTVVGGFSSGGIDVDYQDVYYHDFDNIYNGVAGLLRF